MLHLPATMASQPCNKPDPSIVKAAEAGDMKEVAEFVANGASVNSVDRCDSLMLLSDQHSVGSSLGRVHIADLDDVTRVL
eukprot:m.348112 g.348112  ORF g.348112 m.348112 type:complete len:80 (-) comp27934_c1_seq25:908-1147(-)